MAEEITFKGVQFSCPTGAVLSEGGDRCGKGIKKGGKVNFIRVYPAAHNIQGDQSPRFLYCVALNLGVPPAGLALLQLATAQGG